MLFAGASEEVLTSILVNLSAQYKAVAINPQPADFVVRQGINEFTPATAQGANEGFGYLRIDLGGLDTLIPGAFEVERIGTTGTIPALLDDAELPLGTIQGMTQGV